MNRILDRLGQPEAFSWPVATLSFAPALLVLIMRDWIPYGGSLALWVAVMVLANSIAIGCMVPLRLTVLGRGPRPSRPLVTLAAFLVAGVVRSAVLELLAGAVGLPTTLGFANRMLTGPPVMLTMLATIALIVQAVTSHRRAMLALEERRVALTASRATGEEEMRRTVEQSRERVRATLGAQLQDLDVRIGQLGSDDAAELLRLVDDTVKPLATQLSEEPVEISVRFESDQAAAPRVSRWTGAVDILREATLTRPLSPLLNYVLITVFGMFESAADLGVRGAVVGSLAGGTWFFVMVASADRFLIPRLRPRGPWVRSIGLSLVLAVAAATGTVVLAIVGGDPSQARAFVPSSVIQELLFGWGLALDAAWQRRSAVINRETESAIEALELEVMRLVSRARREKARLARLIHGPVQDRLLAARILLSPSHGSLPSADAVAEATGLLREAHDLLDLPPAPMPPISTLIDQYAATWRGLVDVRASIDPEVSQSLAGDENATAAVAEIIREAIANSVRHTGTTSVVIDVRPAEHSCLQITVNGNGAAAGDLTRPRRGLGTRLLDDEALDWSLDHLPDGTRLRATVMVGTGAEAT